ncbi:astacin [Teladorsagia circumcincta]|uniref:Metalloendopeptidase n=1 Tax=Teladorsagia circumcincta TaxID=45464 RepID=A0A2G9UE76_TELCI|nr:astacin [Teladorsagia circumcincta]
MRKFDRSSLQIGYAAHELGHALGFWHTHVRHDRDEYITVNSTNIDGDDDIRRQFDKQSNKSNDNYGLPYDYGSVMHYGSTAGSINRTKSTMIPKDELYAQTLGSLIISFYDIFMMNIHYNCTGFCRKDEHDKCKNRGFAHPRNCSKCICPSGYGGDSCNERPTVCGAELNVTSNWTQLVTANSSDLEAGTEDGYKRCVYWLNVSVF